MKRHTMAMAVMMGCLAGLFAYFYPKMPVDSGFYIGQFGGDARSTFLSFLGGVFLVVMGTCFILPSIAVNVSMRKRIPDWVNLPNGDYWKAPERRDLVLGQFNHAILIFGLAEALLILAIYGLILHALCLDKDFHVPALIAMLVGESVIVLCEVFRLMMFFKNPINAEMPLPLENDHRL